MENGTAHTSIEDTFIQASDEVQTQIDRIHSQMALYARDLKRMVDAERQKARALADANARLAILDRLKTDFLAFIAHELRTPLSSMVVLDLLDPHDDPQALAEMIDILRRGYERLEKFVEKGLEYFKWLAAERQVDQAGLTDLGGITRAVIGHMTTLHDPAVMLIVETPPTPCLVRGESEDLARVMEILLENALKFSDEEKWVRIRVGVKAGRVVMTISDHGRGFASEMGPELLRPFTIAHVMNHSQGTGLNLALASAIVTAYGGTLSAHSEGVGRGASFTVLLPEVSLL
jgi:signal transduction histidine kinase